jgi:TonB family protein
MEEKLDASSDHQVLLGCVVVKFDLLESGTVENPRIVYEEPKGVFGRSALYALRKFKFASAASAGTVLGLTVIKFLVENRSADRGHPETPVVASN